MSIKVGTKATSVPDMDSKTFASEEILADEVIHALKIAGACIIRNLYSEETMDKLDQEIKPYLSELRNTTCMFGRIIKNPKVWYLTLSRGDVKTFKKMLRQLPDWRGNQKRMPSR